MRILDGYKILNFKQKLYFAKLLMVSIMAGVFSSISIASLMPLVQLSQNELTQNTFLNRVNFITQNYNISLLTFCALVAALLALLASILQIYKVYFISDFSNSVGASLSSRLLGQYMNYNYKEFLNRNNSSMINLVVAECQNSVAQYYRPVAVLISSMFMVIFIFLLLINVNFQMALSAVVLIGGCYGFVLIRTRRELAFLGRKRLQISERKQKTAFETLAAFKEIQIYRAQNYFAANFSKISSEFANHNSRAQMLGEAPSHILTGAILMFFIVSIFIALRSGANSGVVSSETFVSDVIVFGMGSLRLMPEVQKIYLSITQISYGLDSIGKVKKDLTENESRFVNIVKPSYVELSELSLEKVSFRHNLNSKPLFQDVTLTLKPGDMLGIVGESGSGKSTLLDIIMGFQLPTNGAIYLNGSKIGQDSVLNVTDLMSYVPQEPFIFDIGLNENITFTDERVNHERLQKIKDLCLVSDFEHAVHSSPTLGEQGKFISGGQRQRISVARSLYQDRPIIILDEATSALDENTESKLLENIRSWSKDRIVIFVTHKKSNLKICNKIIDLDATETFISCIEKGHYHGRD